jgi:hypothetical protein
MFLLGKADNEYSLITDPAVQISGCRMSHSAKGMH